MPETEKQARAERMRELRKAAGFASQEALADAAGIERIEVNRVETGKNVLTSADLRASFARALDLDVADLTDYLDGTLSLTEVLVRRQARLNLPARDFLSRLERLERIGGLRQWVQTQDDVSLVELALAVEAIESGRAAPPTTKSGWSQFFMDLRAGRFMPTAVTVIPAAAASSPPRTSSHSRMKRPSLPARAPATTRPPASSRASGRPSGRKR
jgi:transcriptional regulator with XRE-family HTH domain